LSVTKLSAFERSKGLNEYQKFRYTDLLESYGIKNIVLNMFNVKSIDDTEEYNNNLDKVKVFAGNKIEYIDIKDVRNKKYDDLRFMNFYVKQNKYKLSKIVI
jgi:ribosomal protein L5